VPDLPVALTRADRLAVALERLAGAPVRLWRVQDGELVPLGEHQGQAGFPPPQANGGGRQVKTRGGIAWLEPVPDVPGIWLEIGRGDGADAAALAEVAGVALSAEQETAEVADELSGRYEEIDLIYTISEILGHTIRLDEAAERIVREVSTVVRARRASLLVLDETTRTLRLAAARGVDLADFEPIDIDDPCSVAARVFRDRRSLSFDPSQPGAENPGCPDGRAYRGEAFLSVPVLYSAPGGPPRPIGVINLTDRVGNSPFTAGDRKLLAAIANQIGAAIANARLVAKDLEQQRVRRELELAHDLQLKLLPSPVVVAGRADVAVRCRPAESVGGDFYNLLRLHDDRVGVMIGDVSSHGFGAALIMALAMAASGIHAESAETPAEVLRRLEESLREELSRTEMYLSLFYAVLDPARGRLTFANAGHPHAFLISCDTGAARRLEATRPPLGLAAASGADTVLPWVKHGEILALFTDGVVDALGVGGDRFGEERVLGHITRKRDRSARETLEAVFADLAAFGAGAPASDDRTLLILKA